MARALLTRPSMSPAELRQIFRRILLRVAADEAPSQAMADEPVALPTLCDGRHPQGMLPTDLSQLKGAAGYLARMAHF